MSPRHLLLVLLAFCPLAPLGAQNQNAKSPPPGIVIPERERAELLTAGRRLQAEIDAVARPGVLAKGVVEYVPDVEIFAKAVLWAVELNEVYSVKQLADARNLLKAGEERLAELKAGRTPWRTATGNVVRGYRSRIDGSIQPYGLVIPADRPDQGGRLDVWLHGRSDVLTELAFLTSQGGKSKTPPPPRLITLNIYGRFCNAYKFAGEVDVLEAMEHAIREYACSRDHVALRGFSMGGAGAWHVGAQHVGLFAAITPGAGFVETAEYAKVDAQGRTPPTPWERRLYALYDVPGYVLNLSNRPVFLYCGDEDPARWQGRKMVDAAKARGFEIPELVGPKTGHKYHPETKKALDALMDAAVEKGRPKAPERIRLSTPTLKYNEIDWVRVNALEEHWKISEVDARKVGPGRIEVVTKGVTDLSLDLPAAWAGEGPPRVSIDGQDFSGVTRFLKVGGRWADPRTLNLLSPALQKRHDLQGPIDDAFMDAFVFVRPTGRSSNPAVAAWTSAEMRLAQSNWQVNFRGEARTVDDVDVTPALAASANLILWGDAESNRVIARLESRLPVRWGAGTVTVAGVSAEAAHHVPILIYPNPEAPTRYVVLNSGYTFRQGSNLTNALQTPKLPDWALVDIREPPSTFLPGRIVEAGWFSESWETRR